MRRINDPAVGVRWFRGYLHATYDEIVNVLGTPNRQSDQNTDAEWVIEEGGQVFNLFNWRNGRRYRGERGLDLAEIREWHIGGKTPEVVFAAKELFPDHEVQQVCIIRVQEGRRLGPAICMSR